MREDLIERLRERAQFEDKRVLDEAKAMGFEPEVYTGSQTGALLREAAELARRVEGAPSVEITACNQIEGALDFDYGDMAAAVQKFDAGQRVRLVPEAGQGESRE